MRQLDFLFYVPKKYFALAVAIFMITPLMLVGFLDSKTQAMQINSSRDCDSNAVIHCGALNFQELKRRYNNQQGVKPIFREFGITRQDIASIHTQAVEGRVTKGGRVIVDGKTVARNAMTAGRHNISGSEKITRGNTTFYVRPPSSSFASSSLPAFVVMENGRFQYAIIASCGNPVKAQAVEKQRREKSVPQPAPTPAPPPTQSQSQVQSQSITVVTPTQTPTPKQEERPAPPPPPPGKTLPDTGVGGVVALGTISTVFGTIGHMMYQRKK